MSIYSALSGSPPTIAYCAFHQLKSAGDRDAYVQNVRDLHEAIIGETAEISAALRTHNAEILDRGTEMLMGMLRQFLQTPLQSDDQEVRTIIRESLTKICEQCDLPTTYGVLTSWEGEIVSPSTENALLKRMMKAGKDYLSDCGFALIRSDHPIFETLFVLEGGVNLDVLEHIIRHRVSTRPSAVENPLDDLGSRAFGVYNMLFSYGAEALKLLEKEVTEAAIFFSKPSMKQGNFQGAVIEALEKMIPELQVSFITLWQRKLGLGQGREFVLRLHLSGAEAAVEESTRRLVEALRWLSTYKEVGFVREALIDQGSLLVKQMVK